MLFEVALQSEPDHVLVALSCVIHEEHTIKQHSFSCIEPRADLPSDLEDTAEFVLRFVRGLDFDPVGRDDLRVVAAFCTWCQNDTVRQFQEAITQLATAYRSEVLLQCVFSVHMIAPCSTLDEVAGS